MFSSLGPMEIVVIGLIAVVLFGGKRLAEVGKGLGQGIRNFKEGIKEEDGKALPEKNESAVVTTTSEAEKKS